MSEWDRKYHLQKNPKLKTSWITIGIVVLIIIGITIAEQIAYILTFPASSESVEIDGNVFYIDVQRYGFGGFASSPRIFIATIFLKTDTNQEDSFPNSINATSIWIIPGTGGIFPWWDYSTQQLIFTMYNFHSHCSSYIINSSSRRSNKIYDPLYKTDLIVEVNTSGGRVFYLRYEALDIYA
ncbi:MAG: hypothetical protein EU530_00405 [Promethearchaeota archaeon]|nr:MAG: hypothetical protein EU530_00405 [Candidatus Lokiarchaeota archaeon]